MFYEDYFTRIEDIVGFNESAYNTKITGKYDCDKAKNLFHDCFSNHVDFDNPFVDKLEYNYSQNSTRYIKRDSLSAYFINTIYKVPNIYEKSTGNLIDLNDFLKVITEESYSDDCQENYDLGSNRLRFIVGDVGEGKSALVKKTISKICTNKNSFDSNYEIFSIYINFEEFYNFGSKPKHLQVEDDFYKVFYRLVIEKIDKRIDLSEIYCGQNIHEEPILSIKRVLNKLKEVGFRFIIFLDNLDFYHYYTAKYSYFNQYFINQDEDIRNNISWLYSLFSKKGKLGNMGLNIVFSVRNYVYADIVESFKGTDTEIDTSRAYSIELTNEEEVLSSRLQLLKDAIDVVSQEHTKQAQNLERIYDTLKVIMNPSDFDLHDHSILENTFLTSENIKDIISVKYNSPIKQISKIGQHGYRTLVHFFSSLNISYLDFELIERFFINQVSTLRLLYFTNIYMRYTQAKNHFPNLFLNDCVVSYDENFKDAHKEHMHTYWLKYFILKYIVKKGEVKCGRIINIFNKIGEYDSHLVLHVLGSLNTANEFRCIEYDTTRASKNINARKLSTTSRGSYFFEERNNVENCFDVEYMQIVVEDKWLSIPNIIVDDFYDTNINYSHLYRTDNKYISISIEHAEKKAISTIMMLILLKKSYAIEIKKNKPELHKFLLENNLIPNLDEAIRKVVDYLEGVLLSFNKSLNIKYKLEKLEKLIKQLEEDNSLEEFFNDYYKKPTEGKKVSA